MTDDTDVESDDLFLPPPQPTALEWGEYEKSGFEPLFFEWYKCAASVLNVISAVQPDSPAFRCADPRHYYVLSGLMHRCVRLMSANVALSHEGSFGETSAIVDRCLCESAIRIEWLCAERTQERVLRYLTDSLRPELEFETQIRSNIGERDNHPLPIETRMMKSIQNHFDAAQVTRGDIAQSKRLPDMAAMLEGLGYDRLAYVVVQRMGSHHIHGTWPSLLHHYLTQSDEISEYAFHPRHQSVQMHVNQYVHGSRFALQAGIAYSRLLFDEAEAESLEALCGDILEEMLAHYREATADDHRVS